MIIDIKLDPGAVLQYQEFYIKNTDFPYLSIDRGSYISGAKIYSGLNFDWESLCHSVQIGRYSAIAEEVSFLIDLNHDMGGVFQGYIPALGGDVPRKDIKRKRKGQIVIQNDCWIGHHATILGGVTIGSGAVVGADACVTKDVPPYAIVAGNPAKIIGYRYEPHIAEKMLKIAWWNWEDALIREREAFMRGAVSEFVNAFYREEEQRELLYPAVTAGKRYLFYMDHEDAYPLWAKVLREFAEARDGSEDELLIYYPECGEGFAESIDDFWQVIHSLEKYECKLQICSEMLERPEDLLLCADYLITNRSRNNIYRMECAHLAGVSCISGVDCPIFNK